MPVRPAFLDRVLVEARQGDEHAVRPTKALAEKAAGERTNVVHAYVCGGPALALDEAALLVPGELDVDHSVRPALASCLANLPTLPLEQGAYQVLELRGVQVS